MRKVVVSKEKNPLLQGDRARPVEWVIWLRVQCSFHHPGLYPSELFIEYRSKRKRELLSNPGVADNYQSIIIG